jgi:hypothetical protein
MRGRRNEGKNGRKEGKEDKKKRRIKRIDGSTNGGKMHGTTGQSSQTPIRVRDAGGKIFEASP